MTIHPHAAECPRRQDALDGRAEQARHLSTPGPWRVSHEDSEPPRPFVCTDGDVICLMDPNHPADDPSDAANVRLIAKAPDMLALLKDCEESFTADDSYALLRDACRKLIAEIEQ